MSADKEKIGSLLDSLYLEMLHLIEQQVTIRTHIERLNNGGQLLLAKTRYVQGTQTVSLAQIPTENGSEFNALCRVSNEINDSRVSGAELSLERQPINKEEGFVDPLNWFGVLAPSSLRSAQQQFIKCLDLVVESANIQRELLAVMDSIERLKEIIAA